MKTIVAEPSITFINISDLLRREDLEWSRKIELDGEQYLVTADDSPRRLTISRDRIPEPHPLPRETVLEVIPYYAEGIRRIQIVHYTNLSSERVSIPPNTSIIDHSWSETFGGQIEVYRKVLEIATGARYMANWHEGPTFRDVREYLNNAPTDERGVHHVTSLPGNIAFKLNKLSTGAIFATLCSHPDCTALGRYIMNLNFSKDREHVTLLSIKSSGKVDRSDNKLTISLDTPIDIDFKNGFDWAERFKKNGELVRQILFGMVSFDRL